MAGSTKSTTNNFTSGRKYWINNQQFHKWQEVPNQQPTTSQVAESTKINKQQLPKQQEVLNQQTITTSHLSLSAALSSDISPDSGFQRSVTTALKARIYSRPHSLKARIYTTRIRRKHKRHVQFYNRPPISAAVLLLTQTTITALGGIDS